jgi:hypothetical protein
VWQREEVQEVLRRVTVTTPVGRETVSRPSTRERFRISKSREMQAALTLAAAPATKRRLVAG